MTIQTLEDYAAEVFPNRDLRGGGGFPITDADVVVAHFAEVGHGKAAHERVRSSFTGLRTELVVVRGQGRTMLPTADEDPEGVTELPTRRLGLSSLVGGVVLAAVVLVILLIVSEPWVAIISAAFAAGIGAWIGFLAGGGARHAGERAWAQPADVDEDGAMAVVGAQIRSADEGAAVTALLDQFRPEVVRIVNGSGWRLPSSFTPEQEDPQAR